MTKKLVLALALISAVSTADMIGINCGTAVNTCSAASYDRNSDGFIYKGTIQLRRAGSNYTDTFYLFDKGGVKYVCTSPHGGYYIRLQHRMTINNIDYVY